MGICTGSALCDAALRPMFPGSGISVNITDNAKKCGIPVWKFDGGT
jgi:hypothetical protein